MDKTEVMTTMKLGFVREAELQEHVATQRQSQGSPLPHIKITLCENEVNNDALDND